MSHSQNPSAQTPTNQNLPTHNPAVHNTTVGLPVASSSEQPSPAPPPRLRALDLHPLTLEELPLALQLDQRCLGGMWSESGYQREIESDRSELWAITTPVTSGVASPLMALGCLWAILDEAHVTLLAVDPAWRRQGLGQYLLWALLQAARHRRMSWAALEVRVSNQIAIELYQSFGFQAIGRRRNYYQDNREDAAILWLKQLQSEEVCHKLQTKAPSLLEKLHRSGWADPSLDNSLRKYFERS